MIRRIEKNSTRVLMSGIKRNLLTSKRSIRVSTRNMNNLVSLKRSNSHFDFFNKKRNIVKSKCSQEEMVGFILIVVLVSVIALVFLGISIIRQPKQEYKSNEVSNFLGSFLQYTTACESRYLPLSMADVIKECAENEAKECGNGELACSVMNRTTEQMLSAAWPYGNESYLKGYEFNIDVISRMNDTGEIVIIEQLAKIEKGNCNVVIKTGADKLLPFGNDDVRIKLNACYAG